MFSIFKQLTEKFNLDENVELQVFIVRLIFENVGYKVDLYQSYICPGVIDGNYIY